MNEPLEVVIHPDKGLKGGRCNVTACQKPGAHYYNKSTRKYYCAECAEEINWPGGRADCMALYGVPLLCELDPDEPPPDQTMLDEELDWTLASAPRRQEPIHRGTIGHSGFGTRGGLLAAAMLLAATAGGVHAEILDDAMGYRRPEEPEPKAPYAPTIQDLDRLAKAEAKRERKLRRNRGTH